MAHALRASREAECLKLLEGGPQSRQQISDEFMRAGSPISEWTIHNCMQALEQRRLVKIGKTRVKGRFSKFRWNYELQTPAGSPA